MNGLQRELESLERETNRWKRSIFIRCPHSRIFNKWLESTQHEHRGIIMGPIVNYLEVKNTGDNNHSYLIVYVATSKERFND